MKSLSRKEAMKLLDGMKVKSKIPKAAVMQNKRNAALDMAIEALKCSEIPNSLDCISRQAAINAICEDGTWLERQGCTEITMAERRERDADILSALPSFSRDQENDRSAEPCEERLISLQAAIDEIKEIYEWHDNVTKERIVEHLGMLPSAQPNLSEAYSKAVFTWLMDYQIRVARLKGRYTPYEVLSWVINDWRKENE